MRFLKTGTVVAGGLLIAAVVSLVMLQLTLFIFPPGNPDRIIIAVILGWIVFILYACRNWLSGKGNAGSKAIYIIFLAVFLWQLFLYIVDSRELMMYGVLGLFPAFIVSFPWLSVLGWFHEQVLGASQERMGKWTPHTVLAQIELFVSMGLNAYIISAFIAKFRRNRKTRG